MAGGLVVVPAAEPPLDGVDDGVSDEGAAVLERLVDDVPAGWEPLPVTVGPVAREVVPGRDVVEAVVPDGVGPERVVPPSVGFSGVGEAVVPADGLIDEVAGSVEQAASSRTAARRAALR